MFSLMGAIIWAVNLLVVCRSEHDINVLTRTPNDLYAPARMFKVWMLCKSVWAARGGEGPGPLLCPSAVPSIIDERSFSTDCGRVTQYTLQGWSPGLCSTAADSEGHEDALIKTQSSPNVQVTCPPTASACWRPFKPRLPMLAGHGEHGSSFNLM